MRRLEYEADLCVVGGGIAGICTALAAARKGIKVVLVHDRPVLGGNASSEVRMWICGAHGKDIRETGIVEELILENFYRNPSFNYSQWDGVMYSKVMYQENLTLLLNSSVMDADCSDGVIHSVTAWQSNAETFHTVKATYFADCSGDSILAPLSGAEHRQGREAQSEYNETIPPEVADSKTMGMSCLFQARETDHKVEFIPPEWAHVYESDEDFYCRGHGHLDNHWWIEIGGEWDCVHDTDRCRDELLKIAYGIWDHIKNHGDHGSDNWDLDWICFLPGKRESRRYVGEYVVTQNDVEAEGRFEDLVAYAGWTMDDHFPEGFYTKRECPTIFHPAPSPWGLPLRCMISKNVKNLVFAGRNISVTHAALSSTRVIATCGILGQAIGTAVAQAVHAGQDVREIDVKELQATLMRDDCYLPWHDREISELSKLADCNNEIVRNGKDRGEENCWMGKPGEVLEYTFQKDTKISGVRLVFDSNLNRGYLNMRCSYPIIPEVAQPLPDTLIKKYDLIGTNEQGETFTLSVEDNRQRLVNHSLDWTVKTLRLVPRETHGCAEYHVFDFEVC